MEMCGGVWVFTMTEGPYWHLLGGARDAHYPVMGRTPQSTKNHFPSMPAVPAWEIQLGWLALSLGAGGLKRMEVTFSPWSTGPCAGLVV